MPSPYPWPPVPPGDSRCTLDGRLRDPASVIGWHVAIASARPPPQLALTFFTFLTAPLDISRMTENIIYYVLSARSRTPSDKSGPRIARCRFSQSRRSWPPFALTTLRLLSTRQRHCHKHTKSTSSTCWSRRCSLQLSSDLISYVHLPRTQAGSSPSRVGISITSQSFSSLLLPNGPRLRQRPSCRYRPSHPLPPSSPPRHNPTLPIRPPPLQNPEQTSSRPPSDSTRPPAPKVLQVRPLANLLPNSHILGPRLYPATMWTADEECGCPAGVAGEDRVVEYCVYSLGIRCVLYTFDEADYVS